MKFKFAIAAAFLAFSTAHVATADNSHPGFTTQDFVGQWGGLAQGSIQGQPFAAAYTLVIARDGSATFNLDSTVGPTASTCNITVVSSGSALLHCVDTSGPFVGAQTDTHLQLTEHQQRLVGWSNLPALSFFLTSSAFRL